MTHSGIPRFLKSQKKLAAQTIHLAVGLGLTAGFLLIAQAYCLAHIINATIFEESSLADAQHWLWAMFIIFVIRAGLAWASEQVAFKAAATIKKHLRHNLHDKLQQLGPAYLASERSGEMVNTLVDGIEALEDYYAKYLPAMSLAVLIPLSILVFVFPLDWVSGLIMLGTAPLIPFFMILIGEGTERMNKRQWRKLARMSAHFLDMLQGLTTLKIFNASLQEANVIARVSEDYRHTTMSVLRVAFLSSFALEFLATVSVAMVAILIGFRLLYGEMEFFYGFFVLLLAPEFYLPLRNMGTHYHARLEAIGAAEKMLDILATPVDHQNNKKPTTDSSYPSDALPFNHSIEFNHVSYSYNKRLQESNTAKGTKEDDPEQGKGKAAHTDKAKDSNKAKGSNKALPALNHLSFTIKKGERIALVGASGSGKTTLTRLLLGFIEPQQGIITIDGQPLSSTNLSLWRKQLAWMPQSPHIFHASVRDNITLGSDAETTDNNTDKNSDGYTPANDHKIIKAAKQASADGFINELTNGYGTLIGEKGQGLSGGQIQRLALSRVFYKDAPLIILDEATANLDANSERIIQASLDKLATHKTIIIIAHRLNTVINADRILVLDKGKIIEQGTHSELLAQQGAYAALVDAFEVSL